MKRCVLLAALVALLAPAAARANGDPASDVLLTDKVFLPYEAPISKSAAQELQATVAEANRKGFKIRVAVIAFTGDLGTAVPLWRHPQSYSKFLWSEVAFVYSNRLLVAMPSGFGFWNGKKPIGRELRVLEGVKPGTTPTALAESTTAAVRALAEANGVALPKVSSGGSSTNRDRYVLGVAVLVFLLVLFVPTRLIRRRGRGGGQSPSAEPR
ncbi:MAG TPA: hypothetical protein VEG40_00970 [Gaiellaceae bacterium]|nr:hypothetical protein [Gaiellaceae bacterium]